MNEGNGGGENHRVASKADAFEMKRKRRGKVLQMDWWHQRTTRVNWMEQMTWQQETSSSSNETAEKVCERKVDETKKKA
jgi:hypothetical protein